MRAPTANAAGANGLTNQRAFRSREELGILFFGLPFNDWPTLLNLRDRTLKRTDRGAIGLLDYLLSRKTNAIPWLCKLLLSIFFFLPLSHKVGTVQHVFHHVVIKIRFFTTGRLTSTLLETGVGANDCKCNWDQQLNVHSTEELEIINFGHPSYDSYDWPLRTLLSFRDRTPSALTAGPSSSSQIIVDQ
jgi:hypothetical protein